MEDNIYLEIDGRQTQLFTVNGRRPYCTYGFILVKADLASPSVSRLGTGQNQLFFLLSLFSFSFLRHTLF